MSNLKCPFCQQKLDADCIKYVYFCKNKKCKETKGLIGSEKMWNKIGGLLEDVELAKHNEYVWRITCEEISNKRNTIQKELIRTRKALDVAKDTFNWIDETYRTGQEMEAETWGKVQLAAQQITALEQKDVK